MKENTTQSSEQQLSNESLSITEDTLYSRIAYLKDSQKQLTIHQVRTIADTLNLPEAYFLSRDPDFAQAILSLYTTGKANWDPSSIMKDSPPK